MEESGISKHLIYIGVGIVLGAWFLLGQKTSAIEKIGIIVTIVIIYVALRFFSGASFDEILAPILQK